MDETLESDEGAREHDSATNWASPARSDFSAVGDFGCSVKEYPWEVVGLAAVLLLFSYLVIF
jgi:hypothetical protein